MRHVICKLFFFWPTVGSDCSSGLILPCEAFQSTRHPDSIVFVETLTSFGTAETGNENRTHETQFAATSSPIFNPRNGFRFQAPALLVFVLGQGSQICSSGWIGLQRTRQGCVAYPLLVDDPSSHPFAADMGYLELQCFM